ncbi:MAG: hypothetical protein IID40_09705, partial [Planctomycetes bacterium]|nr:hypothetical protein [Planctomycetota bacterium]
MSKVYYYKLTVDDGGAPCALGTVVGGLDKAIALLNADSGVNISMAVNDGVYDEKMDFSAATRTGDIHIWGTGYDRTVIGSLTSTAHVLDNSPDIHWHNL